MLFVLANDWDTIIKQTEFVGVKMVTDQIYSEYIKRFILAYNEVSNMKIENIRNNFNGYISSIKKLEKSIIK